MPRHSSPRRLRRAVGVVMVEQPARLQRGEHRVERQPADGGDELGRTRVAQASHSTAVRWSCQLSIGPSGTARRALPEHERLALGAEADGDDRVGILVRQARRDGGLDAGPDLLRRLLDPARLRVRERERRRCRARRSLRRDRRGPPSSRSCPGRWRAASWRSVGRRARGLVPRRRCRRRSGRSARAGSRCCRWARTRRGTPRIRIGRAAARRRCWPPRRRGRR